MIVICQWDAPLEYSWDRAASWTKLWSESHTFFFYFLYRICSYKVHTVACSMHKIGTDFFTMTLHLGFWSSCSYIRRCLSMTFGSTNYLNVLWSVIAVSVILLNELSSICEPSKVSVLLAFMFVWHTVMYDLSLAVQKIVCQNSKESKLTCILQN